jgi:hypothetical protein
MRSKLNDNGVRVAWTGEDDLVHMSKDPFYTGWWGILNEVTDLIEEWRMDGPVEILQVKEKFGGLRVYVNGVTSEQFDKLYEVADQSLKVCQICGKPGDRKDLRGYWILTLCPEHKEEFNERKGVFGRK